MTIPEWADPTLSRDLPIMRARGENQDLEYIEAFPSNVRELAKEVAAFATSNAGTIILGVSNAGDLVGLEECDSVAARDQLLRRLEGICRGTIKPSITPVAKFAVESGSAVLVVTVPKGNEPVYYCHNVPYLRHITESRPAEPHEVAELIRGHLIAQRATPRAASDSAANALLSELGHILITILIYAEEAEERMLNPWLELWRSEYSYAASELREMGAQDIAVEEGISEQLLQLAEAVDEAATLRLYLGSGERLSQLVRSAEELTLRLKASLIDGLPLDADAAVVMRDLILTSSRKLSNLVDRSARLVEEGRIEEVQTEASDVGMQLLQLSYYKIDLLSETARSELRDVGRRLHLLETARVYMDGGESVRGILAEVADCEKAAERLASLVESADRSRDSDG